MVVDIFMYNGEADMLDIRLNILSDYVDQFIIVEATETFSGRPKPLYYKKQQHRFKAWDKKIRYYVVDDYPYDQRIMTEAHASPNVPQGGPEHWVREFYQKESIKKALVDLFDQDMCFVGDVDEIWNPFRTYTIPRRGLLKLRQDVSVYYLNNRSDEAWAGTIVNTYHRIKRQCLNHLRTQKKHVEYVSNGGWHFTNMGGEVEVRRKLMDSYTVESYNTPWVQANLQRNIEENRDYLGRTFHFWKDELDLPEYLRNNKKKYATLFR